MPRKYPPMTTDAELLDALEQMAREHTGSIKSADKVELLYDEDEKVFYAFINGVGAHAKTGRNALRRAVKEWLQVIRPWEERPQRPFRKRKAS